MRNPTLVKMFEDNNYASLSSFCTSLASIVREESQKLCLLLEICRKVNRFSGQVIIAGYSLPIAACEPCTARLTLMEVTYKERPGTSLGIVWTSSAPRSLSCKQLTCSTGNLAYERPTSDSLDHRAVLLQVFLGLVASQPADPHLFTSTDVCGRPRTKASAS